MSTRVDELVERLSDPADPFILRFFSVADWLEVLLVALEEGAYQDPGNPILQIDHTRHEELAAQRLASGRRIRSTEQELRFPVIDLTGLNTGCLESGLS